MVRIPEVGDYARGKKGEIGRITSVFNESLTDIFGENSGMPKGVFLNLEPYFSSEIVNIQKDIRDIVEEDDIVDGHKVTIITNGYENFKGFVIEDEGVILDISPLNEIIDEIITKEEQKKYRRFKEEYFCNAADVRSKRSDLQIELERLEKGDIEHNGYFQICEDLEMLEQLLEEME